MEVEGARPAPQPSNHRGVQRGSDILGAGRDDPPSLKQPSVAMRTAPTILKPVPSVKIRPGKNEMTMPVRVDWRGKTMRVSSRKRARIRSIVWDTEFMRWRKRLKNDARQLVPLLVVVKLMKNTFVRCNDQDTFSVQLDSVVGKFRPQIRLQQQRNPFRPNGSSRSTRLDLAPGSSASSMHPPTPPAVSQRKEEGGSWWHLTVRAYRSAMPPEQPNLWARRSRA
jgi:hypothetical protein